MTTLTDYADKINDLFGYSPTEAQLLQRPDLITIALDAIAANAMTLTEIATALNSLMGTSYNAASLRDRPDLIRLGIQIMATDATGAIADGSVTTAKLADSAVTAAKIDAAFRQTLFNRNYFKNPAFSVIQGTASGTLANSLALPTASLGYLGETEWCIAASGGTPAYAFSSANESVTFTGAASTTAIYLLQRLESRDTNRLKNKTVTFSCEISNSLLTSVIWEVFRPTTTNDVHGTIATPTQTLIASGTFTVNSTLTRYSATFALPDLASRGLEVRLIVGAQTSGTWVIARLQLEEGSVATDFNCDDFSQELVKCRRYSEILFGEEIVFNGYAKVPTSAAFAKNFATPKFAIPVFTDLGSNYVIQFRSSVIAVSSFGVAQASKESIIVDAGCAGGLTAGDGVIVRYGSSTTSVLGFLAHIP